MNNNKSDESVEVTSCEIPQHSARFADRHAAVESST